MHSRITIRGCAVAGAMLAMPAVGEAQQRGVGVNYGRWWHDDGGAAALFAITHSRPLAGPFRYGFGLLIVDDTRSFTDRSMTGGEISTTLGTVINGPYAIGAVAVGIRHGDGSFDGNWSAGVGYNYRPFSFLELGVETRYRVEDQFVRGFWRLNPSDRRGLSLQASLAIRFGRPTRVTPRTAPPRPGTARPAPADPEPVPSSTDLDRIARESGASDDDARVSASIVETAIDVMGTPYRWGGTDENGFDCSGLIQYAYGQHGILLPRISRDQGRTGTFVDKRIDALRPGDILTFSVDGNGVSHVGMYVGEGHFIHSSSVGVRISSLTAPDGDSRWWQQRWVGARRILS